MTMIALAALAAAAALPLAVPDDAGWVAFGTDPSGAEMALALGSVVTSGGQVRVETRLAPPRGIAGQAALFEFELDCRTNTIRTLSVAELTPEGFMRNARTMREPVAPIDDGSNASRLRRIVCPPR